MNSISDSALDVSERQSEMPISTTRSFGRRAATPDHVDPSPRKKSTWLAEALGSFATFIVWQLLLTAGMMFGNNPVVGFLAASVAGWTLSELLRGGNMRVLQGTNAVLWTMSISGTYFFGLATAFFPLDTNFAVMNPKSIPPVVTLSCAASMVLATVVHFWRFRVPVVAASGIFAVGATFGSLGLIINPAMREPIACALQIFLGITAFAAAIWLDISDVNRQTIRARIAFWLHLVGGFFIPQAAVAAVRLHDPGRADGVGLAIQMALLLYCLSLLFDRKILLFLALFATLTPVTAPSTYWFPMMIVGPLVAIGSLFFWKRLRGALLARLPVEFAAQMPRLNRIAGT